MFTFVLFLKTMLFHWVTYHNVLLSSLWKAPMAFFAFWGGKILPVLFLSGFVFISKCKYWTIVINILLDIWCIANLLYFKANGFFLTFEMLFMVDNMNGFWDSLRTYMGWDIVLFILITILYIVIFVKLKFSNINQQKTPIGLMFLITSLIFISITNLLDQYVELNAWKNRNDTTFGKWMEKSTTIKIRYCFPFGNIPQSIAKNIWLDNFNWESNYISKKSIIAYFPAIFFYKLCSIQIISPQKYSLSETENDIIKEHLLNDNLFGGRQKHNSNLIYIIVESLESWPLNMVNNILLMPNLNRLLQSNKVLYVENIISQVKHGNSADGQMIGLTGMLPISNGATCRLYGKNNYPNFAHFYSNSAIINPSSGVWQQTTMTKSYEFQELIEPASNERWNDMDVMKEVINYIFDVDSSFCVLGITITSHVPFIYGVENAVYKFDNMPQTMSAYLNCLHYTDSCISVLIDSVQNSSLADNTTIVITGDHTIFRDENGFSDMTKYAQDNDINFKAGHTFTPLIIYSPQIDENIHITDTCYQMDIFPTILHLIGCEDYYWHGFGVNLLDSAARNNRQISVEEAFILSDKMIRVNYFATSIDK